MIQMQMLNPNKILNNELKWELDLVELVTSILAVIVMLLANSDG